MRAMAKCVRISRGSLYIKIKWKFWFIGTWVWGIRWVVGKRYAKNVYTLSCHILFSSSSFRAPFFFWSGQGQGQRQGSLIIDSPFRFPTRGSQKWVEEIFWTYLKRECFFLGVFYFLKTYSFRVMGFFNFYGKTPLIFFWLVYLKYIFLGFKICFLQPISNN